MKTLNLNELKNNELEITIGDEVYKVGFIPYIIEKDIYTHMTELNEVMTHIMTINDEWADKIQQWVMSILSHKRNGNNIPLDFFDNIGLTELVIIMVGLVNFIAARISNMNKVLNSESNEKKTIESQIEN